MKPFPKPEDCPRSEHFSAAYHYERARADCYASEVVPLIIEAEALLCDCRAGEAANELAQRIVDVLRELEEK